MGTGYTPIVIRNKKATFLFELMETFTAGIVLTGTEIKSIRMGKASLVEAYCYFVNGDLWIKGMHVAEYWWANRFNHDPNRERKLLLNKKELIKLKKKSQEKGLTIIPLKLFINEKGYCKVDIALAKGKKVFDKREDLKSKDSKREMDRAMKQ
ncbi:SsrA-binding protein SmpB [Williamwhitmania taraxaci]|uniref:SsrA-binding protein n=1 Tax=Williamwhitmania taraxaci TaxID=1640674 RepID=A0A1G6LR41_9BACT|nr:SsrA-binding protein SmpB [Williamwhitmania taraxaci]SDC45215.1 SsrA-binding protein [Williamwhitmania taraxaci]